MKDEHEGRERKEGGSGRESAREDDGRESGGKNISSVTEKVKNNKKEKLKIEVKNGERERQLLFQCHSWPPSGAFRPLRSPSLFFPAGGQRSPRPVPLPPAAFPPSFIAPHPCLSPTQPPLILLLPLHARIRSPSPRPSIADSLVPMDSFRLSRPSCFPPSR